MNINIIKKVYKMKKNLNFIVILTLISIFAFTFVMCDNKNNDNETKKKQEAFDKAKADCEAKNNPKYTYNFVGTIDNYRCDSVPIVEKKIKKIEIPVVVPKGQNNKFIQKYNAMIDSINLNINKFDSLIVVLNGTEMTVVEATLIGLNDVQFWTIGKTNNKMTNGAPIDIRIPKNVNVYFINWGLEKIFINNDKWKEYNRNPEGGEPPLPIENPNIPYANELLKTLQANYDVVILY